MVFVLPEADDAGAQWRSMHNRRWSKIRAFYRSDKPERGRGKSNKAPQVVTMEINGKRLRNPSEHLLFHTKLCKFYPIGACTRGSNCAFAHEDKVLRQTPNLVKTCLCPELLSKNRCSLGDSCKYAHSVDDIRRVGTEKKKEPILDLDLKPCLEEDLEVDLGIQDPIPDFSYVGNDPLYVEGLYFDRLRVPEESGSPKRVVTSFQNRCKKPSSLPWAPLDPMDNPAQDGVVVRNTFLESPKLTIEGIRRVVSCGSIEKKSVNYLNLIDAYNDGIYGDGAGSPFSLLNSNLDAPKVVETSGDLEMNVLRGHSYDTAGGILTLVRI